ncbi:MAG: signal peptidase I [Nitrospinae bacterium]|nr:signal peptidase I [Nitrospinota bacterium]
MPNNSKKDAQVSQQSKTAFREYAEAIVIALALALFIRTFIVQAFKIPSGSMEKTLLVGDHILVNKFSYGIHIPNEILFTSVKLFPDYRMLAEMPERGDIIVFKYPRDEQRDFIKRVIGLPGDKLEIRRQKVYINDKPIAEDAYVNHQEPPSGDYLPPRDDFGPTRVPEGHLFVMGDNRENSQDSRYWGFLNADLIKGKALMIYWSWDGEDGWARFGRIGKLLH